MGKNVAIIAGLIIIIGLFLGLVIPVMGLWYGSINNLDANWLIEGSWTPLGEFIIKSEESTQTVGSLLLPQICGWAMLIGGGIIVLGGLAGSRKFTVVGVIGMIFGLGVFALTLQATLDTNDFYEMNYSLFGWIPITVDISPPYDPNFSIFTTLNQHFMWAIIFDAERTQMLGGGYWMATIGTVVSLIGLSGLKK